MWETVSPFDWQESCQRFLHQLRAQPCFVLLGSWKGTFPEQNLRESPGSLGTVSEFSYLRYFTIIRRKKAWTAKKGYLSVKDKAASTLVKFAAEMKHHWDVLWQLLSVLGRSVTHPVQNFQFGNEARQLRVVLHHQRIVRAERIPDQWQLDQLVQTTQGALQEAAQNHVNVRQTLTSLNRGPCLPLSGAQNTDGKKDLRRWNFSLFLDSENQITPHLSESLYNLYTMLE